ncbi:hypothetical protein PR202_gb02497 [Eleusine coracana subsp. coracana]|uniref:Uncharacterized protein n=1 Tax=Eleusine coracana subsp. coracana TaxID=191504 RepID=A0AAV5DZJ0_ELECO|nr:hypothetical protein PR202_gb02497 [Eleusine coracana subsp. coracana]
MACSSTRRLLLAALAVSLVVLACSARPAGAARPVPETRRLVVAGVEAVRHVSGCHTTKAAVVVKSAMETLELLRARLPAGPSPKGPGH